jgi:hypothetical protein
MKKLFFVMTAFAAFTLTSCNKGKQEVQAAPGTAEEVVAAPEGAEQVAGALEKDLNSGKPETFKARIASIIEKIKDLVGKDPAQAQKYFATAQEFLKSNKDKVEKLVGGNKEISNLVSVITDSDPSKFFKDIAGVDIAGLVDKVPDGIKDKLPDAVKDKIPGLGK